MLYRLSGLLAYRTAFWRGLIKPRGGRDERDELLQKA